MTLSDEVDSVLVPLVGGLRETTVSGVAALQGGADTTATAVSSAQHA
jgi:hypothetical protein